MLTFLILLNDLMNVILGIKDKNAIRNIRNIVTVQFYNRYINFRTKIERVLLRLRKSVVSIMLYVCKTETTHMLV